MCKLRQCLLIILLYLLRFCLTDKLDLSLPSLGYDYSQYEFASDINERIEAYNELLIDNKPSNIVTYKTINEETLSKICEDFNLIIYESSSGRRVDCETYKTYDNDPIETISGDADREKRDIEGSGDEPEEVMVHSTTENIKNRAPETPEEISPKTATNISLSGNSTDNTTAKVLLNNTGDDVKVNSTENEKLTSITTTTTVATTTPIETNQTIGENTTSVQSNATKIVENPVIQNETHSINLDAVNKTQIENKKNNTQTLNANKVDLQLNEAKLDFVPKNGTIEKSNKSVMKSSTELEKMKTDDPKNQESSQKTNKATSKDSTILITLFATVVIVGAAAFGYNFIKKKKRQQNRTDGDAVERGSALRRSLQSLTKTETLPENKPLLKQEQEMVEIKNGKATTADTNANNDSKPIDEVKS